MIMNNIEDYSLFYGGKPYGITRFQLLDNKMIRLNIWSSGEEFSFVASVKSLEELQNQLSKKEIAWKVMEDKEDHNTEG